MREVAVVERGTRIGPYEVLSLVGAGGMGEVYRARDPRLEREVAIKMLPAAAASNAERLRRFEREARATAALTHPNILDVHDVGTHEGVPYLVEELLVGESLHERLGRGPVALAEAVEIALQVARGLAAAHDKHIVHRDLKPGNVFITNDGTVKILDFGLAKLVEALPACDAETLTDEPTGLTEAGRVLGTVSYMAPEQACGMPVDARTDLFAFGVLLYEMLAGQRPFRGETARDTVAAILTQEPAKLPEIVPPGIQQVVSRCLAKRPDERFASAHDLLLALQGASSSDEAARPTVAGAGVTGRAHRRRRVGLALAGLVLLVAAGGVVVRLGPAGPSARVARPPRIVVLPFENLGSPEDAYFASGMTEEITSRLANVRGLAVISRTTATEYPRKGKTIEQIGKDLDVAYVLEGSVRHERSGNGPGRVRITPQLIRVADDTHVWGDHYDRVIEDVFAIQSEVAENTVNAMGVTLLPRERTALREVSTNDIEAYDLYLRAQALYRRSGYERTHIEGALQMYQAAVGRDPRFAQALAGLAQGYVQAYWLRFDRSPLQLARANEAARRAVELRPDLAETHTGLAWYFYAGLEDYPRALGELGVARSIQPNSSDALALTGYVLRRQGQWENARAAMEKALELDPRNLPIIGNLVETFVLCRRYAEADRLIDRALELPYGYDYLGKALLQVLWLGDPEKAQATLDEAQKAGAATDPERTRAVFALRVALALRRYESASRILEGEAFRTPIDNQYQYSPVALLRGQVQRLEGQDELARRSFDAARLELEEKVGQDPDDPRLHSSLGIALAGLRRRAEAVRQAKLGCELMPPSRDAWRALDRLEDLAVVYAMVGETGEAIGRLDDLLAASGWFTSHSVRLDPRLDPLKSDPRFLALLTKYEVRP